MFFRRGFTLIELLVVIAIIALLSSIVASAVSSTRVRARDAARIANAEQLRTALEMYQINSGTYAVAGAGFNDGGSGYITKSGVANYNTSIISALKNAGVYSALSLKDSLNGDDEFYLGVCTSTPTYSIYLKVEQASLIQASTTILAGCDGATASSLNFNHILAMGDAASSGSGAGGGGGGGGGGGTTPTWSGYRFNFDTAYSSGFTIGATTTISTGGSAPAAIAFDGVNMWMVNSGTTVFKLSTSGGVLCSFTGLSGTAQSIVYDGANMWIATKTNNSVWEISPSCTLMNKYTVSGTAPESITFDGTNVWTANYTTGNSTKVTPSGATTTGAAGSATQGITFDGTYIWTANALNASVSKVDATTGGLLNNYLPTGTYPTGIASDGINVWTANSSGNSVSRIGPTGQIDTFGPTGTGPYKIVFDGINMWTANNSGNSVSRIAPDGSIVTFPLGAGIKPYDIAFDGTYIWTANNLGAQISKIVAR